MYVNIYKHMSCLHIYIVHICIHLYIRRYIHICIPKHVIFNACIGVNGARDRHCPEFPMRDAKIGI
jgi:hypothetical protein